MEEDSFFESIRGARIGGRYTVDRVLGEGGMGIVAVGLYPELEQKVAIKFLRPEHAANPTLNARFVREGRLAAKVKSEHFVRVFDIGKLESGVPYLVMELLSGRDLGEELMDRGPLPIDVAVDYILQVLVGLAEVHALGVVHRDLKPANLFLSDAGGKRTVKVLDFGISKESHGSGAALTSTENLLGTPHYMSPEQVRASKDVDARSDVWSVGVILYELLTGKRPFVSDENAAGELFAKILYVDPPSPKIHRADLAPELEAIVLRCLHRERPMRFANVVELAEALEPFASNASKLRIETVRGAGVPRVSMPPPQTPVEPELPPTAVVPPSSPRLPASAQQPNTAMTAATDANLKPPVKPIGRTVAIVVGVLAVAAIGVVAIASRGSSSATPTTTSAVGAPATSAPISPPPPAPATTETKAPDPASAPTTTAVAATPTASTPKPARPQPKPQASTKPANTGDIILDRK